MCIYTHVFLDVLCNIVYTLYIYIYCNSM
jgi:hypothetical protein